MDHAIEIKGLHHRFGRRVIYENLDFHVPQGKVVGLLGKNGVGKTTLIKILMGFLKPKSGECRVLGERSHAITPETRRRIGLLFEGHLAYDHMTIEQIERFYSAFYPGWNRDIYYELTGKTGLPRHHRIARMSEGQRSQVVLGLILAQDPELLILDDYSMGLDAGYRRLFLDLMSEYLGDGSRTVLVTSHVIQDMEKLVDEVVFLERGGIAYKTSLDHFLQKFRMYRLSKENGLPAPRKSGSIKNVEEHGAYYDLFSFAEPEDLASELNRQGFNGVNLATCSMSLEDAFIGYTGRY